MAAHYFQVTSGWVLLGPEITHINCWVCVCVCVMCVWPINQSINWPSLPGPYLWVFPSLSETHMTDVHGNVHTDTKCTSDADLFIYIKKVPCSSRLGWERGVVYIPVHPGKKRVVGSWLVGGYLCSRIKKRCFIVMDVIIATISFCNVRYFRLFWCLVLLCSINHTELMAHLNTGVHSWYIIQ